jgi:hypothetical protein
MSSLLEFQQRIVEGENAIFCLDTSELNPKNIKTSAIKETQVVYNKDDYNLKTLREYILNNTSILSKTGSIIQAKIKSRNITLEVLKLI